MLILRRSEHNKSGSRNLAVRVVDSDDMRQSLIHDDPTVLNFTLL
jgi:hypothetical protein